MEFVGGHFVIIVVVRGGGLEISRDYHLGSGHGRFVLDRDQGFGRTIVDGRCRPTTTSPTQALEKAWSSEAKQLTFAAIRMIPLSCGR